MSFTITCNKCGNGNPVMISQDDSFLDMHTIVFKPDDNVTIYSAHDGEIRIECVCGNKIQEIY